MTSSPVSIAPRLGKSAVAEPRQPPPTLSALIVNYRSADLVIRCVRSLLHLGLLSSDQITVVDNASGDSSEKVIAANLPGVRLIPSNRNGGYSAGINLGLSHNCSDLLLVLNPDTYFIDDSLYRAVALFDANAQLGLLGLGLVNPDLTPQYSARRFYAVTDILARRLFRRVLKRRSEKHLMKEAWQHGEPFETDWVMGTGFLIRGELLARLGGMDERYFLYMEDVDLCARVWETGFSVMCMPSARLVHDHQRASARPWQTAGKRHLASLLRFARKYRLPLLNPPGRHDIRRAGRR